jgi:hypothetical protein
MSRAKTVTRTRRDFFKGIAVLGGAATVAAVSGQAASEPAPARSAADADSGSKRYRVTPHVAEYYKKARF